MLNVGDIVQGFAAYGVTHRYYMRVTKVAPKQMDLEILKAELLPSSHPDAQSACHEVYEVVQPLTPLETVTVRDSIQYGWSFLEYAGDQSSRMLIDTTLVQREPLTQRLRYAGDYY